MSVNNTVHPILHNILIPISDATVRSGTMCPSNTYGNPGISRSQICVDFTIVPSGWSGSSTERFSGWDIIPTQIPYLITSVGLEQGFCSTGGERGLKS